MAEIILHVNSTKYEGWENISVQHSMTAYAGAFTVQTTNLSFGGRMRFFGIHNGDAVTLTYNGFKMIDGYIDSIDVSYDADKHLMTISGRDKTADLVDCSYISKDATVVLDKKAVTVSNFFAKQSVLSVISTLCNQFNIKVVATTSVQALLSEEVSKKMNGGAFVLSQGTAVSEEITMLGNAYGFLAMTIGDGKLLLTTEETLLVSGRLKTYGKLKPGESDILGNIISGSMTSDDTERYAGYIVKGQGQPVPTDFAPVSTTPVTDPKGVSEDLLIRPVRTKTILEEDLTDSGLAQKRADWEARIRAAMSRTYTYTVFGWSPFVGGEFWQINTIVHVTDTFFNIDGTFLIKDVDFSLSNNGEIATLKLVPQGSFEIRLRKIAEIKNTLDDFV